VTATATMDSRRRAAAGSRVETADASEIRVVSMSTRRPSPRSRIVGVAG